MSFFNEKFQHTKTKFLTEKPDTLIRTDLSILYEWLRNSDHKKEVVMQSQ